MCNILDLLIYSLNLGISENGPQIPFLYTPDTDESSHLNHTFLERAWEFFQTRSHSITEIYKL